MGITDFYKGTTKTFDVEIRINDTLQDISSDTVTLILKDNESTESSTAILTKTADVATNGTNGVAQFTLTTSDTDLLEGIYWYQIKWVTSGGNEYIIDEGTVNVLAGPVSGRRDGLLCDIDDVLKVLRMDDNVDISKDELLDAIRDTTEEIKTNYDVYKTVTYQIASPFSNIFNGSNTIDITKDEGEVYAIEEVLVGDFGFKIPGIEGNTIEVAGSDYTVQLNRGWITFTDAFVGSYSGQSVYIKYVPKLFNLLCKNKAGLLLLETSTIIDGEEITTPNAKRLMNAIERYETALKPKGVFSDSYS